MRRRRRRLPALAFLGVLGVVAAAAASSASGTDQETAVGSFGTVAPPRTTTTTTEPEVISDRTVPDDEPVLTVPGLGFVPGFDGPSFDAAIAPRLLNQGALAVEIAVAKDGYLLWESAYGVANTVTGESVTPRHRFRIASNSKVITATVILELVADGDLALDQTPLPQLAAQFGVDLGDPRMERVTVRQLLDHTSGIDDFTDEFFREGAVSCEDVTVEALRGRLSSEPGRVVNYSNENFCLLGLLIELVTGEGYEQAVTDRLLTPLGITDMRITGNDDFRPGEVDHPGGIDRNFMEVLGGAGAWVATAADLVRIVDSLDTNRPGWHPIPDELAIEMRAKGPHVGRNAGHWFGLGLRLWSNGTWGHTGTIQNAHSMVLHQPNGYTWAVLVSGNTPADSDDLARYVERAFQASGAPGTQAVPLEIDLSDWLTTTTTSAETTSANTLEPIAAGPPTTSSDSRDP